MTKRKTLKELTIKDNFMFGAVMCDEENCRRLLELVLEIPIERVEVSKEKSIVFHPEYKGVRLDVYARDGNYTHYNVEMQAVKHDALGKRARYYHSQIDMDLLSAGKEYTDLPDAYVIFICDFDPFEKKKYRYTFRNICMEDPDIQQKDGVETIFLNTRGIISEEVSDELIKFLEYVRADLEESDADFNDEFVGRLQQSVSEIKRSRRMEERYMLTELLMQDERRAGRKEGHIDGRKASIMETLADIGTVPVRLQEKIMKEDNVDQLKAWLKIAVRVDSIEQFMEEM